jgi:hypothetical protein
MNTIMTIACVVTIFSLGIVVVWIVKAMRRDLNEMDEEHKSELRDFNDE